MDKMPFYLVFLQSLPETALIVSLGLVLVAIKPRLMPVLLTALITALASYFVRALPLPPGVNLLIQFPIMVGFISWLMPIPLTFAILSTSMGLICITLIELVFNTCITMITGISVQEAIANPLWRILFPIPEFIFLMIATLCLNHYKKYLLNLPEYREMEQVKNYEER